jgi:eukaryotic-like serine/threonine-protein kinase
MRAGNRSGRHIPGCAAWEGRESLLKHDLKHDGPLQAGTPVSVGEQLRPYRIEPKIGQGGMGEVWRARDTRLNRLVALKILKAEHAGRFKSEARAVASLNHPHVCQLYDVGPDYLVLEYVECKLLKGPLAIEETVRLAIQISSALEEAHNRGG